MFGEACHALLRFAISVTFVDTSLTSAYALWWCLSLVHSTLDYGNFVLIGLPVYLQRRLQSVLNAVAWYFDYVVTTMSRTPLQLCTGCVYHNVLTSRWLSACHGVSGATWSRATIPESAASCRRPAQSSPTSVSIVTPTARAIMSANNCRRRTFPVAASLVWNSLPSDIQASSSLSVFRQRLKIITFLFRQSFPDIEL